LPDEQRAAHEAQLRRGARSVVSARAAHELSWPDELQAAHAVRLQRGVQSVVAARASDEPQSA